MTSIPLSGACKLGLMIRDASHFLMLLLALLPAAVSWTVTAEEPPGAESLRLFREQIEPVLKAECYRCHAGSATEIKAGLRLDGREAMRRGGDSGPAVVPGEPAASLLLQALRHEGGYAMPPDKPRLPDATIAAFVRWIEQGAIDPREETLPDTEGWPAAAREHWAFQPVRPYRPPVGEYSSRSGNAVDAFIQARLAAQGWTLAPPASRADWIRRVTFDLSGLPPTPDDIEAFIHDPSPDAEERLIDRLLASPRHGERWAQHWLDLVRFAETEGYEYDRHLPDAWRYRDYVIAAFNSDKPYDEFLRQQLAGDERVSPVSNASSPQEGCPDQDLECQTAAIFHRLGPVRRNAGNPDIALSRNEVLTERTDVLGTALLGLSIGCARCHNHKLEPISQRDYYRLQAYLAATDEHNIGLAPAAEQQAWESTTQRIKEEMQRLQKIARLKTGDERLQLQAQIDALESQLPPPLPTIPGIRNDFAQRTPIHVLRRGVWELKGESVGPRPPSVLVPAELAELPADFPAPRTQLAQWLTDPAHPLTARVLVNRLWQHHFGKGLVKTANDFGLRGERPSHPELLDWLARALVEQQWRLKPLQRLMVLSQTYRQGSRSSLAEAAIGIDPENRLLWRFNRRRLQAEELRDAMLQVAGRLNLRAGGASVMTPVDPELVNLLYKPSQWQVTQPASEHDRRSIYLIAKRNLRLPFLEAFDAPALLTSCPRRESSVHAPQSLELLNGALSNELAAAFAQRLREECGTDPDATITRGFWLALGREPTPAERATSGAYLREGSLREFALALFNLNGFAYVP